MIEKLGRKQRIPNENWLETVKNIRKIVSKSELDMLIENTVKDIESKTKGKKAAFAWSGGKDSLVLEKVCSMAGIKNSVLVVCELEYRVFMEWVERHKPENLEIISTGQDLKWLAAHEHMLFPKDSKIVAQWFHIVQHRGQEKYYKKHNLDVMLLGRRKADGNYVGKGSNIYTNVKGITRYSPLSDWSHEYILAFINYYDIALPPIYDWYNGYLCGTHPWPARQWTGSISNGWREVYNIESETVKQAAEYIKSARNFLNNEEG